MRKLLSLICILAVPCASWAEGTQSSWQSLNAIQAGWKIQVVETNANKDIGKLVSVSDTAISLQEKSGEKSIQRTDVRSVKLMKNRHRLRNTGLGAAIGVGAGAGIGAAAWSPGGWFGGRGVGAAIGAVLGVLIGVAVGAALPEHDTIYRAN
jgi:hypothetical protein